MCSLCSHPCDAAMYSLESALSLCIHKASLPVVYEPAAMTADIVLVPPKTRFLLLKVVRSSRRMLYDKKCQHDVEWRHENA